MTDLCRLTIAMPEALEDEVLEALLQIQPPIEGFTTFDAEGHGQTFANARTRECVRGRIARKLLLLVLPRARVMPIIEQLRTAVRSGEAAWWIEPVEQFGRLS